MRAYVYRFQEMYYSDVNVFEIQYLRSRKTERSYKQTNRISIKILSVFSAYGCLQKKKKGKKQRRCVFL